MLVAIVVAESTAGCCFFYSDHGISTRGAHREIYEFMTEFLVEKWGKGRRQRG
jgi:dipeptidyl aminopeptidase